MSLPKTRSSFALMSCPASTLSSPACAARIFCVIVIPITLFSPSDASVQRREQRVDRRSNNIIMDAGTPNLFAVVHGNADISNRLRRRTPRQSVLLVGQLRKRDTQLFF